MPRSARPPIKVPTSEEAACFRAQDAVFLKEMQKSRPFSQLFSATDSARGLETPVSPSVGGIFSSASSNGRAAHAPLSIDDIEVERKRLRQEIERIAKQRAQIELWTVKDAAWHHLERLGVDRSLDLLRMIFGRKAVDSEFRKPGTTPAPKGREFFIWRNAEMYRAVNSTPVATACRWLAGLGVRGEHESRRGAKRLMTIKKWRTIEQLHRVAEKQMRRDSEVRRFHEDMVKRELIVWQDSGKSFDVWYKERLKWPGWKYRVVAVTPHLLSRE